MSVYASKYYSASLNVISLEKPKAIHTQRVILADDSKLLPCCYLVIQHAE